MVKKKKKSTYKKGRLNYERVSFTSTSRRKIYPQKIKKKPSSSSKQNEIKLNKEKIMKQIEFDEAKAFDVIESIIERIKRSKEDHINNPSFNLLVDICLNEKLSNKVRLFTLAELLKIDVEKFVEIRKKIWDNEIEDLTFQINVIKITDKPTKIDSLNEITQYVEQKTIEKQGTKIRAELFIDSIYFKLTSHIIIVKELNDTFQLGFKQVIFFLTRKLFENYIRELIHSYSKNDTSLWLNVKFYNLIENYVFKHYFQKQCYNQKPFKQ